MILRRSSGFPLHGWTWAAGGPIYGGDPNTGDAMPWLHKMAMLAAGLLVLVSAARAAAAENGLALPWPPASGDVPAGERVTFPSHSPFTLSDASDGAEENPPATAQGTLFMPHGAGAGGKVPAVILLHGASGVHDAREITYARQFAAQGVAALVIDVFGARRDMANGFVDRLVNITEAMFLADAYAGLRFLDRLPAVDGERVALIGFSYGGMAATYAAYEQTAEAFARHGERFAAHVAFYAPCIVEFEDNRATGAPVLMLYGGRDAIVDPARCREVARELEAGGGAVRMIEYPEAVHQWDGRFGGEFEIGRNLADCDFVVSEDGTVRGAGLPIPMTEPFLRKVMLGLCAADEGYLIGRSDAVRAKSNADLADFLGDALKVGR